MQSRQRRLMFAILLATGSVALQAQSNQPCAICSVLKAPVKKIPKSVAQTTTKITPKTTVSKTEPKKSEPRSLAIAEVNALHDLVAAQQTQLEAQEQQLDQLKQEMQQVLDELRQVTSSAQKITN